MESGRRSGAGAGCAVQNDASDAGDEPRGPVADEHSGGAARVLLRRVVGAGGGLGPDIGEGDGMSSDPEGFSGRGTAEAGGGLVPAGVPVRVPGRDGQPVSEEPDGPIA